MRPPKKALGDVLVQGNVELFWGGFQWFKDLLGIPICMLLKGCFVLRQFFNRKLALSEYPSPFILQSL